jgi:hypothetical protein
MRSKLTKEDICEILGVEIGEKFKIAGDVKGDWENNTYHLRVFVDASEVRLIENNEKINDNFLLRLLYGQMNVVKLPFCPKLTDSYYFVKENGEIRKYIWSGDCDNLMRFAFGDCFKTYSDAAKAVPKLLEKFENIKDEMKEIA